MLVGEETQVEYLEGNGTDRRKEVDISEGADKKVVAG